MASSSAWFQVLAARLRVAGNLLIRIARGLARALAHWPWPLPAMLGWLVSWAVFCGVLGMGVELVVALAAASATGAALSLWGTSWWRRSLIACGFPLSAMLALPNLGIAALPAWAWLLPLGLLLLVYPINAWQDAPLFPTPLDALQQLPAHAMLCPGDRVLDAGCGLGDALLALRQAYPEARLHGLERSWLLRWACTVRCPFAVVQHGDIWRADWSDFAMVYLFQRPESMPRAAAKACVELRPGAWLVSLDFEARALEATAKYAAPGGKMVWLYQAPLVLSTGENA